MSYPIKPHPGDYPMIVALTGGVVCNCHTLCRGQDRYKMRLTD